MLLGRYSRHELSRTIHSKKKTENYKKFRKALTRRFNLKNNPLHVGTELQAKSLPPVPKLWKDCGKHLPKGFL
jgi:hypothetical protein